jgi:hypothetical protein
MKRLSLALLLAGALLAGVISITSAQSSASYRITRWTLFAASGGTMTSSSFRASATAAQADASLAAGPGRYSVGGIWTPHYLNPYPLITEIGPIGPPMAPPPISEPEVPLADIFQSQQAGDFFPRTLNLPPFPTLYPPTFPSTLGLPVMPTITILSFITTTFSPIINLTENIMNWNALIDSALFLPEELAEGAGIGVTGWADGSGEPNVNIEIAGYTASEMADALVSGVDQALSFLRSLRAIGVIGPTAAAMIIGVGWIAFVAIVKILANAMMLVVHFVLEIWRLLPFT